MNRQQDDIQIIEKLNMIVKKDLPDFASRYFKANMEIKAPRTLYGYALDLKSFFEYLDSIDFKVNTMKISDMDKISPEIIENYLEFSESYHDGNGNVRKRSMAALKRRYSTLSSFFTFFYRLDIIDINPLNKVQPPVQDRFVTRSSTITQNNSLIDFISQETFDGIKGMNQLRTRNRDIAILMLIIGAGLKVSDCVELNIEDIHLDEKYITVNRRNKSKTVYISDKICQALTNYLTERMDMIPMYNDDSALFLSMRYQRVCIRAVQIMLKRYTEALFGEGNNLTAVALNLSFRNRVFDQTKSVKAVSDISGFDYTTIQQYYRPLIEEYESDKAKEFP